MSASCRFLVAISLLLIWVTSSADGGVNLELRPTEQSVLVGEIASVGLYAVSDTTENQMVRGMQVVLRWDPAYLRLSGVKDDGAPPWILSGFYDDSGMGGLNNTFDDGNAFYQAASDFWSPAWATPDGVLVTTFLFEALVQTPGTVGSILPALGEHATTQVFGEKPKEDVTGTLGQCAVTVHWGRLHVEPIDSCGAQPGDTVVVLLKVSDLPEPINGVQALVKFDSQNLEFAGVLPGDGNGFPWDSATEVYETVDQDTLTYAVLLIAGGSSEDFVVARIFFVFTGAATVQLAPEAPPLVTKLSLASTGATRIPQLHGPAILADRGDWDLNGQVDLLDHASWLVCLGGPEVGYSSGECCKGDFDRDGDVDMADFARFTTVFLAP